MKPYSCYLPELKNGFSIADETLCSDLISELKGVTFIQHRAYLKERKNEFEKYKQSVLVQEYLEDLDLA